MKQVCFQLRSIKIITFITALFCVLSSATNIHVVNTDFSGKWTLNVTKSQFGNIPLQAAVKQFEIKQSEDSIFIKKITINSNNEEKKSLETVSFDSKPCYQLLDSKRTKASAATWSSEGQVLTMANSYSFPDEPDKIEYSILQTWALTNDGKDLIVILKCQSYAIKAVYEKQ